MFADQQILVFNKHVHYWSIVRTSRSSVLLLLLLLYHFVIGTWIASPTSPNMCTINNPHSVQYTHFVPVVVEMIVRYYMELSGEQTLRQMVCILQSTHGQMAPWFRLNCRHIFIAKIQFIWPNCVDDAAQSQGAHNSRLWVTWSKKRHCAHWRTSHRLIPC